MLKQVIFSINLNIGYVQGLIADIPDEQFADQPVPEILINHPAWILGHLATGNDSACLMLGQKSPACPPAWEKLFGFDSIPQPTRSLYPSKAELLEKYETSSRNLIHALESATPSALDIPMEGPMASFFPTIGNYAIYDSTSHTGMHLGQLTTWRRLKKLPRLF
jgi:hypothetical protein